MALDDGMEATVILGRRVETAIIQTVIVKEDIAYFFVAEVTDAFHRDNQDILPTVARSLHIEQGAR